jgi:cytoskeletal protein CcmA (bactofilin family)
MFGKKKANKTVDSNATSSDTSRKDESDKLSGTMTSASEAASEKSSDNRMFEKTEKRTEPRLFTKPRTEDKPQMSSKPHSTNFRPEIPKRPLEIPTRGSSSPSRPSGSGRNAEGKKLTVGRDITLKGEIGSCDILVVEGVVEAQIKDCSRLEVSEGGCFIGSAQVDEAEISGKFEGELTAGRVVVVHSAEIDGKITYGALQIENGARIKGALEYVEGSDTGINRTGSTGAITIPRKSDDS